MRHRRLEAGAGGTPPDGVPVECALADLVWAETERLGLRLVDGDHAQAELREAIRVARQRSDCAPARGGGVADAADRAAAHASVQDTAADDTPELTSGVWWCGTAWRRAPTRADPPGAAPHPFLLA
jgi:hypothetical protein